MGTTVTSNLALIKPDTAESIKEDLPTFDGWAAQNGVNCDKVDALFRKTTHTWTPVWTTDIASNPIVGTGGFIEGKYMRVHPQMMFLYFRIFCGTASFTPGSGLYRLSVPNTLTPEFLTLLGTAAVGKAHLYDNDSGALSSVLQVMYDNSTNLLTFRKDSGDFWRHNTPITLAINDRLTGYCMLPTVTA